MSGAMHSAEDAHATVSRNGSCASVTIFHELAEVGFVEVATCPLPSTAAQNETDGHDRLTPVPRFPRG